MNFQKLYRFKLSMKYVFKDQICPNMQQKYIFIGINQFRNEFLRGLVKEAMQMKDYLRVNLEDGGEIINQRIQINLKALQVVTGQEQSDLNNVFKNNLLQQQFFQTLKIQQINKKNNTDIQKQAIKAFQETCGNDQAEVVLKPRLLQQQDKILYLFNMNIQLQQSKGLKQYLKCIKHCEDYWLRQIVIDSCAMSDEVLEQILDGAIGQFQLDNSKGYSKQLELLNTFVYSGNQIGKKSMQKLKLLLPQMVEFKLNNIKIIQSLQDNLIHDLLENFIYGGKYLMKLSLSNIDLSNDKIIESLIVVLQEKLYLQYLDLSSANLGPQLLEIITNELVDHTQQFRNINLSYNYLIFNELMPADFESSNVVLQNMKHILLDSKILNHVNFSGMKFEKKQILELCETCANSPLLMALHLSDCNITTDQQIFTEVLSIFDLNFSDIPLIRKNNFDHIQKPSSPENKKDLKNKLKKYMRLDSPQKNDQEYHNIKEVNKKRLKLKDNFVLGKELKDLERNKLLNQSKNSVGVGRLVDSQTDQFVITRNLNHPELMFNQNPKFDNDLKNRFYKVDYENSWRFSLRNECFICDKYQYIIVFYERGVIAQNQGLVEVRDEQILNELEYDFNKNYTGYCSQTPLICGTVVNKNFNQHMYERKLKMLPLQIFSLLSICQVKDFSDRDFHVQQIKKGIHQYLKNEQFEYLKQTQIDSFFEGWQHAINDITLNNELTDIKIINIPKLDDPIINKQNWYAFAGFFNPGYHQLLIYDPLMKRAFCKDFVAQLNQRDFVYPEYPIPQFALAGPIKIPNMWIKWQDDTQEDLDKVIKLDVISNEQNLDKFIRNQEDTAECIQIVNQNIQQILIFQKELSSKSGIYPQINWEGIHSMIQQIQETSQFDGYKVPRAQIELQYISANRYSKQPGLKGTMQRMELIEFLLRMAKNSVTETHSSKEKVSNHLKQFFQQYIENISVNSKITQHRQIIRSSPRLNELLYNNNLGLQKIYDEAKKERGIFDIITAKQFFLRYTGNNMMTLDQRQIEECFQFSMMTVHNEKQFLKKYDYLLFIEFQEMVCRLSYIGFYEQEPIEYKVYWLLEYMWQDKYSQGIWTKDKYVLKKINTDLVF